MGWARSETVLVKVLEGTFRGGVSKFVIRCRSFSSHCNHFNLKTCHSLLLLHVNSWYICQFTIVSLNIGTNELLTIPFLKLNNSILLPFDVTNLL